MNRLDLLKERLELLLYFFLNDSSLLSKLISELLLKVCLKLSAYFLLLVKLSGQLLVLKLQ